MATSRLSAGSSPRYTLPMILRQGAALTAAGAGLGLVLTLALSTVISSLLNGVNPRDPAVYAGALAVLVGVTLFATYLPARRAASVDPQEALRSE